MSLIGHQEHERIEYVPAQILVHVERREKLGCKACRGDAVTADRQQAPAITGRADVSVLAHLIEGKCEDALPIHRQADQFKRLGWTVPANTLYGYWKHATGVLEPVAHVVQSKVLGGHALRRYTREYTYNLVGNITKMQHTPASGPPGATWSRHYTRASPRTHAPDSADLDGRSHE